MAEYDLAATKQIRLSLNYTGVLLGLSIWRGHPPLNSGHDPILIFPLTTRRAGRPPSLPAMVGPGAAVIRVWRSGGAGSFCVRNIRFRSAFVWHDHESSVSPVSSQVCAQRPGTNDRSGHGRRSWPERGQEGSAERRTARTYGRRSGSQVRSKEKVERAAWIANAWCDAAASSPPSSSLAVGGRHFGAALRTAAAGLGA